MDKQGREISIKINGKERPFITEKSTNIEMIGTEISATKEEESLVWEDSSVLVSLQQEKASSKRPKRMSNMMKTRVKSAVLSILMAVAVGTSFGFVVLNVIPKQKEHVSSTNSSSLSTVSSIPTRSEDTSQEASTPAAEASAQSLTVSVIQAGVFTDKEAAQTYAKQLQASGIPAVAVGQHPTSLFIAVGVDKEALQPLNAVYKQKGQSTYIKPLSFGAIKDRKLQALLTASEPLYKKVVALSVQLLGKNEVKRDDWASLQNDYKQLQTQSIPKNKDAQQYVHHVTNAYLSLVAYQEKANDVLLWRAQQELLDALKHYIALTQ
jgi:stage II sporulation protein B